MGSPLIVIGKAAAGHANLMAKKLSLWVFVIKLGWSCFVPVKPTPDDRKQNAQAYAIEFHAHHKISHNRTQNQRNSLEEKYDVGFCVTGKHYREKNKSRQKQPARIP